MCHRSEWHGACQCCICEKVGFEIKQVHRKCTNVERPNSRVSPSSPLGADIFVPNKDSQSIPIDSFSGISNCKPFSKSIVNGPVDTIARQSWLPGPDQGEAGEVPKV